MRGGSARKGYSRECGASVATDNAAAAPATVSGEPTAINTTGIIRSWEGGSRRRPASQETCYQQWVMYERVGRGAPKRCKDCV